MKFFINLILMLALTLAFTIEAQAQSPRPLRSFEYSTFAVDTLAASTTKNQAYERYANGVYDLSIQAHIANISGSTGGTLRVQASNTLTGNDWTTISTMAIAAAKDTLLVIPEFPSLRARLQFVTNGTTQSSTLRSHWRWIERKN